jgi:hypothetical protein
MPINVRCALFPSCGDSTDDRLPTFSDGTRRCPGVPQGKAKRCVGCRRGSRVGPPRGGTPWHGHARVSGQMARDSGRQRSAGSHSAPMSCDLQRRVTGQRRAGSARASTPSPAGPGRGLSMPPLPSPPTDGCVPSAPDRLSGGSAFMRVAHARTAWSGPKCQPNKSSVPP